MKKRAALLGFFLCGSALLISSAGSQQAVLRIYFVDIGQGHATVFVSPTGKTLLVDGGPDGAGASAIVPLMEGLGLARLEVMVATHYDRDHFGGLDEVAAVFPPGIAYDSGDVTAPERDRFFSDYLNAVGGARRQMRPGTVIDLGGGATATCIVVNGDLISGGRVGIFGRRDRFDQRDNSSSIGLLVQYGDFDLFVSGDLTGGGIHTTDVESTVAQLIGDVDVLQLNHHGSRTSSNSTFLRTLKAEIGIVQAGRDNDFGHPTIEAIDRFINITPTNGLQPTPPNGDSPANRLPFVFQNQLSPPGSSVSHQGVFARGTFFILTDGQSLTVTGGRLPAELFTFPLDGAETGVRTDFPPSVILKRSPIVPTAGQPVSIQAQMLDDSGTILSPTLTYAIDGGEGIALGLNQISDTDYLGLIPGQPDGALVRYAVSARDEAGHVTVARSGYFSGTTPMAKLRQIDARGVPRFLGLPARIAGSVTVGSGNFSRSNNDVYLQDATAGVNLFELRSQTSHIALGDCVSARGRVSLFNGALMLDITNPLTNVPFTSPFGITKTGQGEAVVPLVRTLADIDESVEGRLVQINGVRVVDGSIPSSRQNANLVIADATGEVTLRVLRETGISGMPTPSGEFTVVGVVGQFDRFRPFDEGYQLLPRNRDDFLEP